MLLCAFVAFLCLFVLSLTGLVLLHRHIESRSLKEAVEGAMGLEDPSAGAGFLRRKSARKLARGAEL